MAIYLDPFGFTIEISNQFAFIQIFFAVCLFMHFKHTFVSCPFFGNFPANWLMPAWIISFLAILVAIHSNLATAAFQKLFQIFDGATIETFFNISLSRATTRSHFENRGWFHKSLRVSKTFVQWQYLESYWIFSLEIFLLSMQWRQLLTQFGGRALRAFADVNGTFLRGITKPFLVLRARFT